MSIEILKRYVDESHYIVALTGAGISTNAGIPDFRGEKGIYTTGKVKAEEIFDINFFLNNPSPFYKWAKELFEIIRNASPTISHYALAKLEETGKLKSIITQNIDNLHQKAGSKNVIELHGSLKNSHCIKCGKEYSDEDIYQMLRIKIPECECGGIIKPDIVFFGEPVQGLMEAEEYSRKADLFIVIGSSLMVQPASILPYLTKGKIVIINKGLTAFPSDRIDLRIDDDADFVFKEIIEFIK